MEVLFERSLGTSSDAAAAAAVLRTAVSVSGVAVLVAPLMGSYQKSYHTARTANLPR